MTQTETKYFDLHIQGIGYLNRIREVKPARAEPFWATDIAAIFGSADNVQRTRFDCRVVGAKAQRVIAHAKKHVDGERKVLVAFKLGDLYPEPFTYEKGAKAGTTGVSLKARLLRIDWVRVDGRLVYTAPSVTRLQSDCQMMRVSDPDAQLWGGCRRVLCRMVCQPA